MSTTQTEVQTGRLQLRGEVPDWKKQLDAEGLFHGNRTWLTEQGGPLFEVLYPEKGRTVMHPQLIHISNRLGWVLIGMIDLPGVPSRCRITTKEACT
jgi:hypothetical protein